MGMGMGMGMDRTLDETRLDSAGLDETGKDRHRTGKGGGDWERDCNIKPTACCSRCNSGGPRPGSTLGRILSSVGCGWGWGRHSVRVRVRVAPGRSAWRGERTLARGVPTSSACVPACLPCPALLLPSRRQPKKLLAEPELGEIGRIR